MGELNIDKGLIDRCNSLSQFNAGNVRAGEWESTFQKFDQQFPITADLTEEQAAYLRERREKYKGLVEAAANDNLRRRAAWVPWNVAGRSNYDARGNSKKVDMEVRKNGEYHEKVSRFLDNTARRLEAMTPLEVVLDRIRAQGLGYGEVIQSDDPHAIEKLEAKLEHHKAKQDHMKAHNIKCRKDKAGTPFPGYELSSVNRIIHDTQGRIDKLRCRREQGNTEQETADGIRVVENTELDRLQIFFPDIPPEETRALVKQRGFRWSRKNGAWQRQLTGNARYAAERLLEELKNA